MKIFHASLLVPFMFLLLIPSCQEDTIEPVLTGSISGIVLTSDSSKAVPGANITTNPASNAVITDKSGKFLIDDVPVGGYTLQVKKNGFRQVMVNVSVSENHITEASIIMEKDLSTNLPPRAPSNPFPADKSSEQPLSVTLKWNSSLIDESLPVKYDLNVYESNSVSVLKSVRNYTDTILTIDNLKYKTTYFWQVTANDTFNSINGEVWCFTTREIPSNPIVFATDRDGNYEIYSADSTLGNTVRLTNNIARDWYPRYSPDRNNIAFVSDRNNQPQIYIMNNDGTGICRLTAMSISGYNNYGIGLCWSSDSKQLLFSHYNKLYRINADGTNLTDIATAPADRNFRECDWSPANNLIVVLTQGINPYDNEIYTMNTDGSNMNKVVDNLPGIIESPGFSKDGNSIIYTRDVSGFEVPEGKQLNTHIFLMNLSNMQSADLSAKKNEGTNDLRPRFSADGGRIIFENRWADDFSKSDIWLVDLTGIFRYKLVSKGEMPDWK